MRWNYVGIFENDKQFDQSRKKQIHQIPLNTPYSARHQNVDKPGDQNLCIAMGMSYGKI